MKGHFRTSTFEVSNVPTPSSFLPYHQNQHHYLKQHLHHISGNQLNHLLHLQYHLHYKYRKMIGNYMSQHLLTTIVVTYYKFWQPITSVLNTSLSGSANNHHYNHIDLHKYKNHHHQLHLM